MKFGAKVGQPSAESVLHASFSFPQMSRKKKKTLSKRKKEKIEEIHGKLMGQYTIHSPLVQYWHVEQRKLR